MLACFCGGLLEIPALIAYFVLSSLGVTAWATVKYNKWIKNHHKTCSTCVKHGCEKEEE